MAIAKGRIDARIFKELNKKTKYIWYQMDTNPTGETGVHLAGGNSSTFKYDTPSTWGFNTHINNGGIRFRFNQINLTELVNGGLTFYTPIVSSSAISSSVKSMELTKSSLAFYSPFTNTSNVLTGSIKSMELTKDKLVFYKPKTSTSSIDVRLMELTQSNLTFYNPNLSSSNSSDKYKLMELNGSGLTFFDGSVNNTDTAVFSTNTRIGLQNSGKIEITPDYFQVITKKQNTAIKVSTEDSQQTVYRNIPIMTSLNTTQTNSISVPELSDVASGTSFTLQCAVYFTEGSSSYPWVVGNFTKGTSKTITSQTSYFNYSVVYVAGSNAFEITFSNVNSLVTYIRCHTLTYQKTMFVPQIYIGGDTKIEGKITTLNSLKVGNNLDVSGYGDFRGNLTSYGYIKSESNIRLPNNTSLQGRNKENDDYYILAYISPNNNAVFGADVANRNSYLRGDAIYLRTKNGAIHAESNILPSANKTYNLGSANYYWNQLWIGGNIVRDTAPSAYSQTYAAVWHKTDNNNYTLVRPTSSSIRYKEDIKDIANEELNPHNLYNIKVKQFKFKRSYLQDDDPYNRNRYDVIGLIAEDIEKNYPIATIKIDGEPENWNERYIIPPMLALIQEQHKEIEQLKEEVAELKNKVNI